MDAPSSHTTRIESRHRSGNTAFIKENQAFQRSQTDFLKERCSPLLIGFGVSLGRVE